MNVFLPIQLGCLQNNQGRTTETSHNWFRQGIHLYYGPWHTSVLSVNSGWISHRFINCQLPFVDFAWVAWLHFFNAGQPGIIQVLPTKKRNKGCIRLYSSTVGTAEWRGWQEPVRLSTLLERTLEKQAKQFIQCDWLQLIWIWIHTSMIIILHDMSISIYLHHYIYKPISIYPYPCIYFQNYICISKYVHIIYLYIYICVYAFMYLYRYMYYICIGVRIYLA